MDSYTKLLFTPNALIVLAAVCLIDDVDAWLPCAPVDVQHLGARPKRLCNRKKRCRKHASLHTSTKLKMIFEIGTVSPPSDVQITTAN